MPSKYREERIVAAAACPVCMMPVGTMCIGDKGATCVRAHSPRRKRWQAIRDENVDALLAEIAASHHERIIAEPLKAM